MFGDTFFVPLVVGSLFLSLRPPFRTIRYFYDCLFAEKPGCGPQSRSRLTTGQHSALSDRCQRCVRTIIVRSLRPLPVFVFPLLSVVNSLELYDLPCHRGPGPALEGIICRFIPRYHWSIVTVLEMMRSSMIPLPSAICDIIGAASADRQVGTPSPVTHLTKSALHYNKNHWPWRVAVIL